MRRHPKMPKTPEFRKYFLKVGFSTFFTPIPNFPKNSFKKQVISVYRTLVHFGLSHFCSFRSITLYLISDYHTLVHFGLSHFGSFRTIALSDYRISDY